MLFACSFNAVRSPMAAGILGQLAGPRLRVSSAGVRRGRPDPFVMAVMDEIGIDLTAHEPRAFADLDGAVFDRIISLSPEAHHNAVELTRIMPAHTEYWPTFDPSILTGVRAPREVVAAYRSLRDDLAIRIKAAFDIEGGPTI